MTERDLRIIKLLTLYSSYGMCLSDCKKLSDIIHIDLTKIKELKEMTEEELEAFIDYILNLEND